jgi:hypothetical protein
MNTTATETVPGVGPPANQNRWTRSEARWDTSSNFALELVQM